MLLVRRCPTASTAARRPVVLRRLSRSTSSKPSGKDRRPAEWHSNADDTADGHLPFEVCTERGEGLMGAHTYVVLLPVAFGQLLFSGCCSHGQWSGSSDRVTGLITWTETLQSRALRLRACDGRVAWPKRGLGCREMTFPRPNSYTVGVQQFMQGFGISVAIRSSEQSRLQALAGCPGPIRAWFKYVRFLCSARMC